MFINESFLSFIWKHLYFDTRNLTSRDKQKIEILSTGTLNRNAGPDFLDAKIKINDILWVGAVEIHVKSSHWNFHKHQYNPDYNKVILQIVWDDDTEVFREDNTAIPTVQLMNRVPDKVLEQFRLLVYSDSEKIPCSSQLQHVKGITILSMIQKALMIRLEKKSHAVFSLLDDCENNWEEVAYRMIMKNFGFKVNQESMLLLSRFLPLPLLSKHRDDPEQMEALMFGLAGFLDEVKDEYQKKLKDEYEYLIHKYHISRNFMKRYQWKFLRLHPQNFPTVRIAQLAVLLSKSRNIFSLILNATSLKQVSLDLAVLQSEYWTQHYDFGKPAKKKISGLGEFSIRNILINTFVPVLVAYGKYTDQQIYINRALDLLESLPPEDNRHIRNWSKIGVHCKNAFDSQGLIELYTSFCYKKLCLNCNIGSELLLTLNR